MPREVCIGGVIVVIYHHGGDQVALGRKPLFYLPDEARDYQI